VVEECDVADGQAQYLDLGELLVGRKGRQHAAQSAEGGVERLDTNSLAGRVRRPVALGGTPVTPSLLPGPGRDGPGRGGRRSTGGRTLVRR